MRKAPFPLASERHVFLLALMCVFTGWLGERLAQEQDVLFTWSAVGAYALLLVLVRVASAVSASILQRPALAPTLAVQILFWSAPMLLIVHAPALTNVLHRQGLGIDSNYGFGVFGWIATPLVALVMIPALRIISPEAGGWRRLGAALLLPVLAFLPLHLSDVWSAFYYSDYEESSEAASAERADAALDYTAEDLLAVQDTLVDRQLAALAPQRPGQVDLYLVAMAGDGAEDVFRNEVELVVDHFDRRFDTAGRSAVLLNHVDTLSKMPMATLRNLRRTLAGIGRIIDPAEDIVFVFMTSHGADNHEWSVQLGDFALAQIAPDDVHEAFEDAGIRWRVAVVSACYSGGYVDALAAPTSLVITASSADRSSFGCGADAELTYFGRAYFAEALEQTADFVEAFRIASAHIDMRERQDGFEPSQPQMRSGTLIERQLASWRESASPQLSR